MFCNVAIIGRYDVSKIYEDHVLMNSGMWTHLTRHKAIPTTMNIRQNAHYFTILQTEPAKPWSMFY